MRSAASAVDTTPDEFVMNTIAQLGLRLWSALYFSVFDMTADSTLEGLKRPVSSRCNSLTFTAGTKNWGFWAWIGIVSNIHQVFLKNSSASDGLQKSRCVYEFML